MSWGYNEETGEFGYWTVWVWDRWLSDVSRTPIDTEVTFVRGKPTQIHSIEDQDPFGDNQAMLEFPGVTGWDSDADLPWLKPHTNVDIYFLPCTADSWTSFHGLPEQHLLNPLTNSTYLYLHEYDQSGNRIAPQFEGYFTTITPGATSTSVMCRGALYQVDEYFAKPLNPLRPKRVEEMISRYFDPTRRGLWTQPLEIDWTGFTREYTQWDADRLYAQGGIRFLPTGPNGTGDGIVATQDNDYGLELGTPWTTWLTRSTGNWEKALTGYVNGMLALMYAKPSSMVTPPEPVWGTGITNGDHWTIRKDPGRKPVMYLKRQADPWTHTCWYGAPGVDVSLSKDAAGQYNVVFAQGTGSDGIEWNEVVPIESSFITWQPLYPEAAEDSLYVGWEAGNDLSENYDGYAAARERATGQHVSERYVSDFPPGVNEDDARLIAQMWAERDKDAGWVGSITLSLDVFDSSGDAFSRWRLRSGDVLFLKGWQGEMDPVPGVNVFFITRVVKSPMSGTVDLTVDTKYRDALTVQHATASGKDTLSITYSQRVGQMMNQIQDLAAPWSQNKGAGVMPRSSHKRWTKTERFPYTEFTTAYGNRPTDLFKPEFLGNGDGFPWAAGWSGTDPEKRVIRMLENPRNPALVSTALSLENTLLGPLETHGLYIPIEVGSVHKSRRWAFFPVLLANAGQIMRTEFACYDRYGNLRTDVEFHVSMYAYRPFHTDMPRNPIDAANEYSALWDGAFERVQRNGLPWPTGELDDHWGTDSQRIGWGTYDRPGGYWPGVKDFDTLRPTGMLVDSGTWPFDMTGNDEWNKYESSEQADVPQTAISWWVAIYAHIVGDEEDGAETSVSRKWAYFRGRVYRSVNLGSGS